MLIDNYALACSKLLCYNTCFVEGAVPHGAGLTVALFLGLSLYLTICLLQAFVTFVINTVHFTPDFERSVFQIKHFIWNFVIDAGEPVC